MKTVRRPRYREQGGALCQFCEYSRRCIVEDSLGDKNCGVFLLRHKSERDHGIEVYHCTIGRATEILEDLTKLAEKASVAAQVRLASGDRFAMDLLDVKGMIMERIRYLSDLLPKVRNNRTFTLRAHSALPKDELKANYKAVMGQLEKHRMPEELMEELKQIDEELKKCSSQQESSVSSSGQPSLSGLLTECITVGELDQTTLDKIANLMTEKKKNANP